MTIFISQMFGYKRKHPYTSQFGYQPAKRRTGFISLRRPPGYKQGTSYQVYLNQKRYRGRNLRTGGYLGKELKFVDYSHVSTVPNTWSLEMPAVGSFNAVAIGNGESERNGRKITNASLHIRGSVSLATGFNSARIRVVLVKDNQTNGAALTPASVISGGIDGFRNLEHISRFQILSDKTYTLNPSVSYDGSTRFSNAPKRSFSINVRTSGDTLYDGSTAAITDITDVSYQIIAIADHMTATTITYTSRFRYRG